MHWIRSVTLVFLTTIGLAAISAGQLLPDSDRFDRNAIPVFRSRVFRVPDGEQSRALQLLGTNDFRRVTPNILKELFGDRAFDTKEMLTAQAAAAVEYATTRERDAQNPFFGNHRTWMAAHARAHREFAAYTRSLSPDLRPYLIKGQVYFEGTGGFSVVLAGRTLQVNHSCLGRVTPPKQTVVILVFLERDIEAAVISASIAE